MIVAELYIIAFIVDYRKKITYIDSQKCAKTLALKYSIPISNLAKRSSERDLVTAFMNLCFLLRNLTAVNSKVIAVTIRPEPKATESHLEIELAHLANVSTTVILNHVNGYNFIIHF